AIAYPFTRDSKGLYTRSISSPPARASTRPKQARPAYCSVATSQRVRRMLSGSEQRVDEREQRAAVRQHHENTQQHEHDHERHEPPLLAHAQEQPQVP